MIMSNTNKAPRRLFQLLCILIVTLAAPAFVLASAQRDEVFAPIDKAISEKRYNDAILSIEELLETKPERFEEAQRRVERILEYRDGFNAVAEEMLQVLIDDPTNYEKHMEFIARLMDMDAAPNRAIIDFLERTEENAFFAKNRNELNEYMDEALRLWRDGDPAAAVEKYRQGFSLYRASFTEENFSPLLVKNVLDGLAELEEGLDRFASLDLAINTSNEELSRLVAAKPPEGMAAIHTLIAKQYIDLLDLAVLRRLTWDTVALMENRLDSLRTLDPLLGDNLFIPFALRLLTGRKTKNVEEGIQAVLSELWTEGLTKFQTLVCGLADDAYALAQSSLTTDGAGRPALDIELYTTAKTSAIQAMEVIGLWSTVLAGPNQPIASALSETSGLIGELPDFSKYSLLARAMDYALDLSGLGSDLNEIIGGRDQSVELYQPDSGRLAEVLSAISEAETEISLVTERFGALSDKIDSYIAGMAKLRAKIPLQDTVFEPFLRVKTASNAEYAYSHKSRIETRYLAFSARVKELDWRISQFLPAPSTEGVYSLLDAYSGGSNADNVLAALRGAGRVYKTAADKAAALADEAESLLVSMDPVWSSAAVATEILLRQRSELLRSIFLLAIEYERLSELAAYRVRVGEIAAETELFTTTITRTDITAIESNYTSGVFSSETAYSGLKEAESAYKKSSLTASVLKDKIDGMISEAPLYYGDPELVAEAASLLARSNEALSLAVSLAEQYQAATKAAALRIEISEWSKRIANTKASLTTTLPSSLLTAYENGSITIAEALERVAANEEQSDRAVETARTLIAETAGFIARETALKLGRTEKDELRAAIQRVEESARSLSLAASTFGRALRNTAYRIRLMSIEARIAEAATRSTTKPILDTRRAFEAGQVSLDEALDALRAMASAFLQELSLAQTFVKELDSFRQESAQADLEKTDWASISMDTSNLDGSAKRLVSAASEGWLESVASIYGLPLLELEGKARESEGVFRAARLLIDGQLLENGIIGQKDPKNAIAPLTLLVDAIQSIRVELDLWLAEIGKAEPEFLLDRRAEALFASEKTLRSSLESLSKAVVLAMADAQQRIAWSESAISEGDLRYAQAKDAMDMENFEAARERLQSAAERYDYALSLQYSEAFSLERDEKLLSLAAEISKAENAVVVREVRAMLVSAREAYFSSDYALATDILLSAQDRWRTTNVEDDGEIIYWLALVRAAASLQSDREISMTAPLYSEMSQLLSSIRSAFEDGKRLIALDKRAEALTALENAARQIREVKILFPLNREAGLMQLLIEQLSDPENFEASFRKRVDEAKANLDLQAREAYAELMDLLEINPRYPGLAATVEEAKIKLGLSLPTPTKTDTKRSADLTMEAKRIVDEGRDDQYAEALEKLNEALTIDPQNEAAAAIKDEIQLIVGGQALSVLTAAAEQDYQRAVRELQKGNTILALAIVEAMLKEELNRNSTRVIELERRIKARL